jgi:hypothetical protein
MHKLKLDSLAFKISRAAFQVISKFFTGVIGRRWLLTRNAEDPQRRSIYPLATT